MEGAGGWDTVLSAEGHTKEDRRLSGAQTLRVSPILEISISTEATDKGH